MKNPTPSDRVKRARELNKRLDAKAPAAVVLQRLVLRRRRCQWLMELKNCNDCGKTATHIRTDCGLAYCAEHAALLGPYTALEPFPQNTEVSSGANNL
jgi:hypothetical protein